MLRAAPAAPDRLWRAANAVAFGLLGYFLIHFLTGFRFAGLFTDDERLVDFRIWYLLPRYMLEHLRYPASQTGDWVHAIFPYLPSAAAMMLPLSALPQWFSFGLWLAGQTAAFAVVVWSAVRLSGAAEYRGWPIVALVAALLAGNAIGWDLRNHNNNLIYLALVQLALLTSRTWLAAVLLALSCNLKLYSGLLIVALGWRREYRLALAAAAASVALALLLPLAVFGPAALPQLAADWLAQIRYTASPANQAAGPASLFLTVSNLLGSDPTSPQVGLVVRLIQAGWSVGVASYFLAARRTDAVAAVARGQVRLCDACVALMAPLPLSTWFIPYHAVPMFPAFALLIVVIVGREWPAAARGAALTACIASQAVRFAVTGWPYRPLVFLAEFTVLIGALAVVRESAARQAAPSEPSELSRQPSLA